MTLALEGFGREALEDQASRTRSSPEALVGRAARHYFAELGAGRAARRLPRFRREPPAPDGLELELDLEPEIWEALQQESRREGVAVERVLEHAVMYLVADYDSGRVDTPTTGND